MIRPAQEGRVLAVRYALALLSGLLFVASFPRFGQPAFAWIALAPLLVAVSLEQARPVSSSLRSFGLGLLAGQIYFTGTLYWVGGVMAYYGDLPGWLSVSLTLALAAYQALFVGLFAVVLGLAVRRFGVSGVWLAPFLWVAAEYARSSVGFGDGFPWVLLGSSQARVLPIVQTASVAGVFGLSFLLALVSSAAAAVALSRRAVHRRGALAAGALVVAVAVAGTWRVTYGRLDESGEVLRVGLVQGNVEQTAKWDASSAGSILQRYLTLSRQALGAGAQLVMWPEAATPFYFDAESAQAEPIRRLAIQSRTPFLIGSDDVDFGRPGEPTRYYNAAMLIGPDGRTRQRYRKMRLVPFGEYVPLKPVLFFVGPLIQAVSDFSAGTEPVVFDLDGQRFSVAICYESVYPWIDRAFVLRGSELLATITNDAWFGTTSAAYQHFDQGAIRAVEEGRYVVRAANTGISGAVDPYGRQILRTRLFEPTAVTADVRLLHGSTIYTRTGDVVAWVSCVVAAWVVVIGIVRARPVR